MTDMNRRILIAARELARKNPRFRRALASELRASMRTAAGKSLRAVLEGSFKDFVSALAKHLQKEFPEVLTFKEPFEAGVFEIGVTGNFESDIDEQGETRKPVQAEIGISVVWGQRKAEPKIFLQGTSMNADPLFVGALLDWDESPEAVVARLGGRFAQHLDTWFISLDATAR